MHFMDSFKIIIGIMCSLHTAVLIDYLIRFRPCLPEKYVLKKDYERVTDQWNTENREAHKLMNTENREAHKLIFQKLDEFTKSQNLILIELGKMIDRKVIGN